jgi:hypothetical protein
MADQTELRAEWERINAEWKALTAARTKWLDDHMADFAEYPIGTPLYATHERGLSGDGYIGKVSAYKRFHRDRDPKFDGPSIYYETDQGDNSSRLSGRVESAAERAERLTREAGYLPKSPDV